MSSEPNAAPREALYVPDRFEGLRDAGSGALKSIIVPVTETLRVIDERVVEMRTARRGSLMILRGQSGSGKSTFLDTVGLFRTGVVTERIPPDAEIGEALGALAPRSVGEVRIVVLEGREALGDVSADVLEAGMHQINSFLRAPAGKETLIVWPANTDDLSAALVGLATRLGGDALIGLGEPVQNFTGPTPDRFIDIAERTIAALNEGASLAALGISSESAKALISESGTIGTYLARVRRELTQNDALVRKLLIAEQYRLWTVVVAGGEPEADVAALTRGGFAFADIDRLMTATGANVVKELKKYPDRLGILGTVLDAKILNLDMVSALAVARAYGNDKLHSLMKTANMSTSFDKSAEDRLTSSELGLILQGRSLGTRKRGGRPGPSTKAAFASLAGIAQKNDGLINDAVGRGLVNAGLIDSYETEKDLGTALRFTSDLYAVKAGEPVRIEVMWRMDTSRAEIANYVLGKLGNYSRAIGLLE